MLSIFKHSIQKMFKLTICWNQKKGDSNGVAKHSYHIDLLGKNTDNAISPVIEAEVKK